MESTIVYWGYIGILENKMETTIVYWGYTGTMENEMETTMVFAARGVGTIASSFDGGLSDYQHEVRLSVRA